MGALEGQELDSARREKDMQALTTISIRQRRSDLSFAPALHYTCADARWANVGAFAGLEDVVVLAPTGIDMRASRAACVGLRILGGDASWSSSSSESGFFLFSQLNILRREGSAVVG
jgi:hypothetical protein